MKEFWVEYDFEGTKFPNLVRIFKNKAEAEAFAATTADGKVVELEMTDSERNIIMTYNELIFKIETTFGDNAKYIMQNGMVKQELEYVEWREAQGDATENTYEGAWVRIEQVAEAILTPANIKVGDGVTVNLWTDRYAATVIWVTKTSVTVQRDKATLNLDFKPEWIPGGFAGHCINQYEQTYSYERDPNGKTYDFRWSNKYGQYGQPGNLTLSKGRHEFYDYNF